MSQSFVFSPEWNGYRPSATGLVQKLSFFVFTSVEGKGTPLPFEAPANHLASFFFPLPMSGDPRSLKCKHLCDPHSLITVTFWLLDNFSSTGERVSFPPPRFREPSRDNQSEETTLHNIFIIIWDISKSFMWKLLLWYNKGKCSPFSC